MNGFSEAVLGVRRMLEGGPALRLAPGAPAELRAGVGAVVQTSGSSGAGRLVVLSRAALLAAAAASRQRLGADLTWHLALAPHYVAGLMVLVRSLAGGRQPVPAAGDLSDLEATGDACYPQFGTDDWAEVRREARPDLGLDWVWWERTTPPAAPGRTRTRA